MARKYTEDYIQKLIDDNGWAPEPKERVNTETWQRASKNSTEIPTLKQQSGAGRTSSASSSAVKRTQSTGSNMTDDQILERIRKYTQKGYQMTGAEQEEMRSITDAVNKATSDAINNYTDGQWDFSTGNLPGGTEITGNEYQPLLK